MAFAADTVDPETVNTVITLFLRGGADGLRILAPNTHALGLDYLTSVRAALVPGDGQLLALPGTAEM